ncbi:MAG: molybdopterin-dependent oxidoreductase [Chloroflexi bacterium]|nr:molybdopterin-dependent oxidoreductase [Chloroflexota bacterium]
MMVVERCSDAVLCLVVMTQGFLDLENKPSLESPQAVSFTTVRLGRRLFLGLMAAGAVAFFAGRPLLGRLSRILTAEGFRIYAVGGIPQLSKETWRLVVDGLVSRPLALDYEALNALPAASMVSDFQCVTGWSVRKVRWEGVRLGTLVDLAQPFPEATHVTLYSGDGLYTDSISIEEGRRAHVLLAYRLNDGELSAAQGWPLRLINPRMYGYKGPKWLVRLQFESQEHIGYWERRGYPVDGTIGKGVEPDALLQPGI